MDSTRPEQPGYPFRSVLSYEYQPVYSFKILEFFLGVIMIFSSRVSDGFRRFFLQETKNCLLHSFSRLSKNTHRRISSIARFSSAYPLDQEVYQKYKTALTIAGSDPSGGAGVQADLKTFSSLGCYGMSVVTALTAQNTLGVQSIHPLPSSFIREQLQSIFTDIDVAVIKIGMLERAEIISEVASCLKTYKKAHSCSLVVDPVMFAKSGHQLIKDDAIDRLKKEIMPLTTILTPNIPEACRLLGIPRIASRKEMEKIAFALLDLGPEAVIVKGGALENKVLELIGKDCLVRKGEGQPYWLENRQIDTPNLHGTGCTFSAAIASYLAHGNNMVGAVRRAKYYISQAIEEGAHYQIGKGKGPVHHFYPLWPITNFTQRAFLKIEPLYKQIRQHMFLQELAAGSLPVEKFAFYIQQDYLFLLDRAEAFSLLAAKAPTQELRNYLTEQSNSSLQGAENIYKKYHLSPPAKENLQKSPACKSYTEEMLKIASERTFIEGLVFLLPCTLLYQKIGEALHPNGNCPPSYKLWIDTYSSVERRKKVEVSIGIVDQIASKSPYEELQDLHAVFHRASQLEYNFWDDAYHLRRG